MNKIIDFKTASHKTRAILFCETYGIIEYQIKENELIYYRNCAVAQGVYRTYKHTVNLDTMQETIKELKKLNKKGFINR